MIVTSTIHTLFIIYRILTSAESMHTFLISQHYGDVKKLMLQWLYSCVSFPRFITFINVSCMHVVHIVLFMWTKFRFYNYSFACIKNQTAHLWIIFFTISHGICFRTAEIRIFFFKSVNKTITIHHSIYAVLMIRGVSLPVVFLKD